MSFSFKYCLIMKKPFDLRFVIGLFFLTIGTVLLIYEFFIKGNKNNINIICSVIFIAFGIFMLLLSRNKIEKG